MTSESKPFLKKTVRFDALEPFGFVRDGSEYRYEERFLNDAFLAQIRIDRTGAVFGRVIDLDTGDDYLPIRSEASTGSFVGAVRSGYEAILSRIAGACFTPEPFLLPQTNRIALALLQRYGDRCDHPFSKLPTYATFRHPETGKWYGLLMDLKRSRVTGEPEADAPVVEILNLKIDPSDADRLLGISGIYPGYHMKRPEWISIVLDGTVPDERILELLSQSRSFASRGAASRHKKEKTP